MNEVCQAEVVSATVDFVVQRFLSPLIISGGAITEFTEARADVTVSVAGRRALGRGSIYLSDLWAWPEPSLTCSRRDAELRRLCQQIAGDLPRWCGGHPAHPPELGLRLHENICRETTIEIKLLGWDNAADVAQTVAVYRMAGALGAKDIELSVDANCANPDSASVLDYLHRLRQADASAYAALRYLEQPTGRDITVHRFDWREVAKLKPVLLDEGLTGLELLPVAASQGWSGFALKTCKGHSFALTAAAWAREHGLALSFQDLTNPGLALIHAALFAAHVPTLNDVELNSPQFTPAANQAWLPRLGGLFTPHAGWHELPAEPTVGLGTVL